MAKINRSFHSKYLICLLGVTSLMSVTASVAWAQTATPSDDAPKAASANAVEEIVVTGTRIRGVAPVGSEVIQVDQDELQRIGAANLSDALRTLPQALNLGVTSGYANTTASATSTNFTSANTVNLRGIGTEATLLLVDGRRVAGGGVVGAILDPSTIPQIAVSGLEVVADGASAIYGSDAIAGVVNARLLRDYEGAETQLRYGGASNDYQWNTDQIVGHKWDGGGFMLAYEHNHQDELKASDRSQYYNSNLSAYGIAPAPTSYQASPGNIQVSTGTVNYATGLQSCSTALPCYVGIPAGSGTTYAGLQTSPGVFRSPNIVNLWSNTWVTPESDRDSIVFNGHQQIFDGVEISNEFFYTERDYARDAGYIGNNLTIPNTNPNSPCASVSPRPATGLCSGTSSTVDYRFTQELPQQYQTGYTRNITDTLALNAKLWAGWHTELSGTYSRNQDDEKIPAFSLTPGLTATSAFTAGYNPFGSVLNANNVLLDQTVVSYEAEERYILKDYAARFDGPLFSLPAGDVKAATGFEYQTDAINRLQTQTGSAPTNINDSRDVKSVYGEVFIPVIDGDMNIPFVYKLDLDAAGRYEDYSDFGHTSNPKIGLNWTVEPGLLLRGSYGTSFRAPELTELTPTLNSATVVASEPLATGGNGNVLFVGGGNPGLQPETATTYSFGPEWRPKSIPGLKLAVDYYHIDYKNQILAAASSSNTQVLTNPAYSPFIIAKGASLTQAVLNQWLGYINANGLALRNSLCPPTLAPTLSCISAIVDGREVNTGETLTSGLDISAEYGFDTSYGTFDLGLNGNYVLDFKTAVTPASALIDNVGNNNGSYPVRFRGRAKVDWQKDAYRVTTFVNYTSSYTNNTIANAPAQSVPSWTTVDLNASYNLGFLNAPLDGITLSINIVNLLDAAPPSVAFEGTVYTTFDPQNANALGRQVSLQLTKKW